MKELTPFELDEMGCFCFPHPKEVKFAKELVKTYETFQTKEYHFYSWKGVRQQIYFWD